MKYLYTLFCLLVLSVSAAFAQDDEAYCKQMSSLRDAEMRAAELRMGGTLNRTTASVDIDIRYHRCEWYVNPAVNAIYGAITTYFSTLADLGVVYFDLRNNMLVDSVLYHGRLLSPSRIGDSLVCPLPLTLARGSFDSLTVCYHGAPVSSGFGSFVLSSHSGVPAMFTLSEPYGAKDWWPCKNSVDDKIDSLDVIIKTPAAFTGVSNGLHIASAVTGDTAVNTWKHRYPITSYLVAIAATNYTRFDKSVQLGDVLMPMETFCYPENFTDFESQTQSTLDALQLYHSMFGPYPFLKEKYGHTQFAWGGGEEHQTNSFVKDAGESLCAHELAHQWFGDKVTCASFADIWLNEGFATHSASLFMELRHPDKTLASRRDEIANITSTPGGSVYVDDTGSVSRIFDFRLTYLKGSHLLYMLRLSLGENVFWNGVRNYLKDERLAYRYVYTADLQKHLEQSCACSLDSFFRQWVYGQGYPSYTVEWTQIGVQTVQFRINQATSHSSVSLFQMKVPLRFYGAGRDTTLLADQQSNGQLYIRDIGFIADSVAFDPDFWLISKNNRVMRNDSLAVPPGDMVIYPSPFRDECQVMLTDFPGTYVAVAVYSVTGQTVYKAVHNLYQGKAFIRVEGAALAPGNYILLLVDQQGRKRSVPISRM